MHSCPIRLVKILPSKIDEWQDIAVFSIYPSLSTLNTNALMDFVWLEDKKRIACESYKCRRWDCDKDDMGKLTLFNNANKERLIWVLRSEVGNGKREISIQFGIEWNNQKARPFMSIQNKQGTDATIIDTRIECMGFGNSREEVLNKPLLLNYNVGILMWLIVEWANIHNWGII